MRSSIRNGLFALAAGLCLAAAPALAQDAGGNSGSGLSPSASRTGNDRSAGVNNGNYRPPGGYGTRRSLRRSSAYRRPLLGRARRY